jgi:hypothetical protein
VRVRAGVGLYAGMHIDCSVTGAQLLEAAKATRLLPGSRRDSGERCHQSYITLNLILILLYNKCSVEVTTMNKKDRRRQNTHHRKAIQIFKRSEADEEIEFPEGNDFRLLVNVIIEGNYDDASTSVHDDSAAEFFTKRRIVPRIGERITIKHHNEEDGTHLASMTVVGVEYDTVKDIIDIFIGFENAGIE